MSHTTTWLSHQFQNRAGARFSNSLSFNPNWIESFSLLLAWRKFRWRVSRAVSDETNPIRRARGRRSMRICALKELVCVCVNLFAFARQTGFHEQIHAHEYCVVGSYSAPQGACCLVGCVVATRKISATVAGRKAACGLVTKVCGTFAIAIALCAR